MPFQPVPFVIGLEVLGILQGETCENTFYYSYTPPLTIGMLTNAANAANDAWVSDWKPIMTTGFTLTGIYARDLNTETGLQVLVTDAAGQTGAVTGDTLPNADTVAVARISGLTGRSARGRIFWMGLAESQVNNNRLTTTFADDVVDAVKALDAAVAAEGFTPVIVSRVQDGVTLAAAVTYDISNWLLVDTLVDSRKSRKPR